MYSKFLKSAPVVSSTCRLYNDHVKDTQRHGYSCHVWPQCMILKSNHVQFTGFVLLAVSEEAKTWVQLFFIRFSFCGINVWVRKVISWSQRMRLITQLPQPWFFRIWQEPHPIIVLCIPHLKYNFEKTPWLYRSLVHSNCWYLNYTFNKNTLTNWLLFVFFSGLANDHMKESFELKHELDGKMFPCHYIKIGEFCWKAIYWINRYPVENY